MKQTIIPRTVEPKPTKAGDERYIVEDTERYIYSVFDMDIANKLTLNIGKACDVDVQVSKDGKYKTIREFYASGPGAEARIDKTLVEQNPSGFQPVKDGFERIDAEPEKMQDGECQYCKACNAKLSICGTYKLTIEKL